MKGMHWRDVRDAGAELQDARYSSLDGLYLDTKLESARYLPLIYQNVEDAGNQTNICVYARDVDDLANSPIANLKLNTLGAAYASLGQKLDPKSEKHPVEFAIQSWRTVYEYYWSSAILFLVISIALLQLTRKHKFDLFDWISTTTRILAVIVSICFLALSKSTTKWVQLIESPSILPVFASMLFLILLFDRIGAGVSNWRLKRSGEHVADDHAHGHDLPPHGMSDSKHDSTVNFFEMHRPMSNETTGYHPQPLAPGPVNPPQPYSGPTEQHSAPPVGQYVPVHYQT